MTRIDMTTRGLHELLKPVIPHTLADADWPELSRIRIEVGERSVVAVATDKLSLGAERHPLDDRMLVVYQPPPIAIYAGDAKAALALFTFSKDDDPQLRITIDRAPVPVRLAGTEQAIDCHALTIEDGGGRRMVLRDCLDPLRDPTAGWRAKLSAALYRKTTAAPPALCLHASGLARWVAAVRRGERLAIYTGDDHTKPDPARPRPQRAVASNVLLVLVEHHFAGLWVPATYLDGPEQILAESPWRHELAPSLAERLRDSLGDPAEQPDDPALD